MNEQTKCGKGEQGMWGEYIDIEVLTNQTNCAEQTFINVDYTASGAHIELICIQIVKPLCNDIVYRFMIIINKSLFIKLITHKSSVYI